MRRRVSRISAERLAWMLLAALCCAASRVQAQLGSFDKTPINAADEALVFTPAGFRKPGVAMQAAGGQVARLQVKIVDRTGGHPAYCRVNVVGADGNFYQPKENPLAEYSLTGQWPDRGAGNRAGKAPIRYFGRFFYTRGDFTIDVPEGAFRVEVGKGFEYQPVTLSGYAHVGQTLPLSLTIERTLDLAAQHYYGGDPHLHFVRGNDADDDRIFHLLDAEDIRYGIVMCYNETNAYTGSMSQLIMPQLRGLGKRSQRSRDTFHVVSGQEYRNAVYGHINLFWRDDLVLPGQSIDPNHWPVFGLVGAETKQLGGYAIHAHGGYAQEIYADLVQSATTGVELLQFGIYRGIGLPAWYRILNAGFQFPAVGASDYPACRKLGDCRTYVRSDGEPTMHQWLAALGRGASFISTGPGLLLDVDGAEPGDRIDRTGVGPHRLVARARARCEVTPITNLQLIVNGEVVRELKVPRSAGQSSWLELCEPLKLDRSAWIAARAFSLAPSGSPDAESHTNPVYFFVDGRAPYQAADVDWLASQLDAQIAEQEQRKFAEQAQVVAYYRRSREMLDEIKRNQGQPAPAKTVGGEP